MEYIEENKVFELNPGIYKVECGGGKGSIGHGKEGDRGKDGGYGAYVEAVMYLNGSQKTKFYLNVAGCTPEATVNGPNSGGPNGGGSSGSSSSKTSSGGGGGATDLRINQNTTDNRIMVAAGGSGGTFYCSGAQGGDENGYYVTNEGQIKSDKVDQIAGMGNGIGQNGQPADGSKCSGSGGGGGWRGGVSLGRGNGCDAVAHSGSSYILSSSPKYNNIYFENRIFSPGASFAICGTFSLVGYECPKDCFSCIKDGETSTKCTLCNEGFFLYNGECKNVCPDRYVGLNRICEKCADECATCEESQTKCTSCNTGYLHNNKCKEVCDPGFIGIGTICEECDKSCKTCSVSQTNCESCNNGTYLFQNKCKNSCEAGYIGLDWACKPCIEGCSSCSSSQDH